MMESKQKQKCPLRMEQILRKYALMMNQDKERDKFEKLVSKIVVQKLNKIQDKSEQNQIVHNLITNQYGWSQKILIQHPPQNWQHYHDQTTFYKNLIPQIYFPNNLLTNQLIVNHTKHLFQLYKKDKQRIKKIKRYMLTLKDKLRQEKDLKNFTRIFKTINKFGYQKDDVYRRLVDIIEQNSIQQCNVKISKILIQNTFLNSSQQLSLRQIAHKVALNSNSLFNEQFIIYHVNKIYQKLESTSSFTISQNNDNQKLKICKWTKTDIKNWSSKVKSKQIQPEFSQTLAVIYRTCQLINKYTPRNTQLVSIVCLYKKPENKGLLAQINTGQGKSLIVAVLAAILALQHHTVDVITTSTELTKRQVKKQSDFFQLLSLTVAQNQSQKAYNSDIVYGTSGKFQGDILRTEFMLQNIRNNRQFDRVIVDEVDSMLFDDRNHSTQLSYILPAVNHLDLLVAQIYQFASMIKRQLLLIKEKVYFVSKPFYINQNKQLVIDSAQSLQNVMKELPDMVQFMKQRLKQYIDSTTRTLTYDQLKEYKEYEFYDGKLSELSLIKEIGLDNTYIQLANYNSHHDYQTGKTTKVQFSPNYCKQQTNRILSILQSHPWRLRKPYYDVLPHLKQFVQTQKQRWIHNIIHSLFFYERFKHYQIKNYKIAPIDYGNTGVIQQKMVWSNGLTQFLQFKQNLPLTSQTVSTNFISSVGFFKRYKQLYGLTGTLGNQQTNHFFNSVYNSQITIIPPYRHLKVQNNNNSSYICKQLKGVVVNNKKQWQQRIIEQSILHAKCGQGVLIICQHIKTVMEIYELLKKQYEGKDKIFIYTGQQSVEFKKQQIDSGQIIIATNIAGRGTDIKTSYSVQQSGGLHVCVTLLPSSLRVELQNVGRTSRQGKRGTSQLIILTQNQQQLQQLKSKRLDIQNIQIQQAIHETKKILLKDQLFSKFCQLCRRIVPDSQSSQKKQKFIELKKLWYLYQRQFLTGANNLLYIDALKLQNVRSVYGSVQLKNYNSSRLYTIPIQITQQESEVNELKEGLQKYSDDKEMKQLLEEQLQQSLQKIQKLKTQQLQRIQKDKLFSEINQNSIKAFPNKIKTDFRCKYLEKFQPSLFELVFQGKQYQSTNAQCQKIMDGANWGEAQKLSIQQRWGYWMKSHLESMDYNHQSNFESKPELDEQKYLRKFEQFEKEIVLDAQRNQLIKNPYYYIRKGNSKPQQDISSSPNTRFESAQTCYYNAINISEKTSSNAYYNLAFHYLLKKQNNRPHFATVSECLKKAFLLIEKHDKPELLKLNSMIADKLFNKNNYDSKNLLTKKILCKLNVKSKQQDFILAALGQIQQAKKKSKQCNVEVGFKHLRQVVLREVSDDNQKQPPQKLTDEEKYLYSQAIMQARANGLCKFYTLTPKQPTNYGAIFTVILLGALQIAAGSIMMYCTAGAYGQAFISEGISDIIYAFKSIIKGGEFSWSDYGKTKAIGYGIALMSFGWGLVSDAIKKGKEAGKEVASVAIRLSL